MSKLNDVGMVEGLDLNEVVDLQIEELEGSRAALDGGLRVHVELRLHVLQLYRLLHREPLNFYTCQSTEKETRHD